MGDATNGGQCIEGKGKENTAIHKACVRACAGRSRTSHWPASRSARNSSAQARMSGNRHGKWRAECGMRANAMAGWLFRLRVHSAASGNMRPGVAPKETYQKCRNMPMAVFFVAQNVASLPVSNRAGHSFFFIWIKGRLENREGAPMGVQVFWGGSKRGR
jgi:hypothetical protein